MIQFDESKVISPLHIEKAEVGKKYWGADELVNLKEKVELGLTPYELKGINKGYYPFKMHETACYQFLYPYEEPPKQRMTNRQLAEWLTKGNGEYTHSNKTSAFVVFSYSIGTGNQPVAGGFNIRTWDSEEWVEPTVDIYKRDCKGDK